jgi:FkbM family methyltransferase
VVPKERGAAIVWSRHAAATQIKRILYSRRGEPYEIGGKELRFTPGTRPVRLRYANSTNGVNRYDALQLKLLSEQLREGHVAFDIGAHVGAVALVMAALCGQSGRVVAFEPDPAGRRGMAANFDINPGIRRADVEIAAVSDIAGQASFFSDGGGCNSSLVEAATGEENPEEMIVQTVTLDDFIARSGLHPDWVKIDVEGAEIRVLRGARKLLSGEAQIVCELHPYAWEAFGDSFDELRSLVAAAGRRMRYLDQAHSLAGPPSYGIVVLGRA